MRKNYERTFHDWVQLHIDFIDQLFLQGEDALRELRAKEAKEHYTRAQSMQIACSKSLTLSAKKRFRSKRIFQRVSVN